MQGARRSPRRHTWWKYLYVGLAMVGIPLGGMLCQRHFARPTLAQQGDARIRQQIYLLERQALAENCIYTVLVQTDISHLRVTRWSIDRQGKRHPKLVASSEPSVPRGVRIVSTTIPNNQVLISEHGFLLATGQIRLRAVDGSRAVCALE